MTLLESPQITIDLTADRTAPWVDVCAFEDLVPDVGVAALVDGEAVAVFRCWPTDELHAIANVDPYTGASVLSRGIVGSVGDRPVVASPMFKQRFDLTTGVAIDDHTVQVAVYEVATIAGRVVVGRTHDGVTTRKRHGNTLPSP